VVRRAGEAPGRRSSTGRSKVCFLASWQLECRFVGSPAWCTARSALGPVSVDPDVVVSVGGLDPWDPKTGTC
jgi:hypothetical protein